jgi:hypothetical protein
MNNTAAIDMPHLCFASGSCRSYGWGGCGNSNYDERRHD